MMKLFKKLLAVAMVAVLALTVLPLLAAAAAVEAYVTPAVMQFFL